MSSFLVSQLVYDALIFRYVKLLLFFSFNRLYEFKMIRWSIIQEDMFVERVIRVVNKSTLL